MFNSENKYVRGMLASIVIVALSAFNFIRIEGHEDVRAVMIVTLLACGVGIGILFINLIGWIRSGKK